ncbi:MAG: 50S ribosomal protein L29 [Planctomycetota bacterium]|nr:50S ribosomal protein L29 [Planctomycetota bacterium]
MKGKDVHGMKDEELSLEARNLRVKLFDLRSQSVTEKVEDTSQFGKIRKDVARLLTEQRARRGAKQNG